MYKVIIVDDEIPTLRFIQGIISKYASQYSIEDTFSSSVKALEYLQNNDVDLLVTDISMPGMDGIELSLAARTLQPDIHIIIISGHAEFDYAKGAIQAGVDEYILKPINITSMTEALRGISVKLGEEYFAFSSALLSALVCGQVYDTHQLNRIYGNDGFHFAWIRWKNLNWHLMDRLTMTSLISSSNAPFTLLRGRDEDEQLLLMPHNQSVDFLAQLEQYTVVKAGSSNWTIIHSSKPCPLSALPDFITQALQYLRKVLVIGKCQMLPLSTSSSTAERQYLSNTTLTKYVHFVSADNMRTVKEILFDIATRWDKQGVTQQQAFIGIHQLVQKAAIAIPSLNSRIDEILNEMVDALQYAASYGDLLASAFTILFEDKETRDLRLSTEDFCEYALQYIRDHFAQPINMQNVCSEIGISQTYMSRLLRKFGNTSFSAYLTKCRIEAAMTILQEHPDVRLRDVAACVGYDDSSYFTKVFHQVTGRTPSQYLASLGRND